MATYTCSRCGTHASSKCVNRRTTFLTDDDMWMVSALETLYTVERQPDDDHNGKDQLVFTVHGLASDETTMDAIKRLINYVHNIPADKAFCDHVWVIDAGEECLFGCCTRPTEA